MYSNSCCSCSFEPKIIKVGQSSHKMYSNNLLNFQGSTTILKFLYKKVWKLIEGTRYVTSGIIRHYVVAFACLHFALPDTRVFSSYEELCITRVVAVNSFTRVLKPRGGGAYILLSTDVSLYHNSSYICIYI